MTRSPDEWARLLKENWDRRASSPNRDFYVASHPGWSDPERWARQAQVDVDLMFHGLDPDRLQVADVLEIGCGVGRLVTPILRRARSYTGFDVSGVMVAEARQRCAGEAGARFFTSEGLTVPEQARNRRYDLAIAMAVFIHCPRDVMLSLVKSAYALLKPGGQLRFQLLADPEDPAGLVAFADTETTQRETVEMEDAATEEQLALIEDDYYMGQAYRYADVAPMLQDATGGAVSVVRLDLAHIYGWVERPA